VTDLTGGAKMARAHASIPARRPARLDLDFPVIIGGERRFRWAVLDPTDGSELYALERPTAIAKVIAADFYYFSGEIIADVDTTAWPDLPREAQIRLDLAHTPTFAPFCQTIADLPKDESTASGVLPVGGLQPGAYLLRATSISRPGALIAVTVREAVDWPPRLSFPTRFLVSDRSTTSLPNSSIFSPPAPPNGSTSFSTRVRAGCSSP